MAATAFDAWIVRHPPELTRTIGPVLSRGVPARIRINALHPAARRLRVRQVVPAGLELDRSDGDGALEAELVPRARGRYELPQAGVRAEGRLGLGAVLPPGRAANSRSRVYPDLATARRLAVAAREGRLPDSSRRALARWGWNRLRLGARMAT